MIFHERERLQVRIKNRERTMGKIEKMVRDGAEKLLVSPFPFYHFVVGCF